MGKFKIYTGKDAQVYFKLVAGNGEEILKSEGYKSKVALNKGIASVKKNAAVAERFETKVAKDGQHYFVLKAGNHQVIGVSEMYKSVDGCNNGIQSVKKNAPDASIDDTTV